MAAKQEKIIIKTSAVEIEKIKAVMEKMALIPSVEMSALSYSHLGSDTIVSFDIDEGHFSIMIEKLYSAGINVLPTNDKVIQILEILYGKYGRKNFAKAAPVPSASNSVPSFELIDEIKNNGKYEDLLKITKMVSIETGVKEEARKALPDTVKKYIDQNYSAAFVNKYAIQTSMANLLKLCADMNLKTYNLQAMQKHAGISAIAICENYTDQIDELIKISNNNQLPNVINLKAAVKFWEIVSKDLEKFPGDLALALKLTNLRFLENAYDIAHTELNDKEKELYAGFRDFIRSNKK